MAFSVNIQGSHKYELDVKISSLMNLFKEIHKDYNQNEHLDLNNLDKNSFDTVLSFCNIIDYKKLNLPKPLYLNSDKIHEIIKSNNVLFDFYENLNINNISDLINTVDFLGFECLESLIYFKIYDEFIFKNKKQEKNFEKSEEYDKLYNKYFIYCQKFVEGLSQDQINNYLEHY